MVELMHHSNIRIIRTNSCILLLHNSLQTIIHMDTILIINTDSNNLMFHTVRLILIKECPMGLTPLPWVTSEGNIMEDSNRHRYNCSHILINTLNNSPITITILNNNNSSSSSSNTITILFIPNTALGLASSSNLR